MDNKMSDCQFDDAVRVDPAFNQPFGIGDGGAVYWANGTSLIDIADCLSYNCCA
jgi:hypothetical protein